MPLINILKTTIFILLLSQNIVLCRTITKIIEETDSFIVIRTIKEVKTEADLAPNYIFLGLPTNNYPKTEIISIEKNGT